MAAFSRPRFATLKAGGTIRKGRAVKHGSSDDVLVECTASTDKSVGLAANDALEGEAIEYYQPGGGGKGHYQTNVSRGDFLTSHTDGTLKPATGPTDRVCAMAMEQGVAGDHGAVEVMSGFGPAAS